MKFRSSKRIPTGVVSAVLAGLTLTASPVLAIDYLSVAETAVLYDAPSQKAQPLWVMRPGTPVETVVTLDQWVKVRDERGDLAWIDKRQLTKARTLQVRTDKAQVRASSDEGAPLVFEAEKGVVLELLESAAPGWVKVRHRDGQVGFVKVGQVWGL